MLSTIARILLYLKRLWDTSRPCTAENFFIDLVNENTYPERNGWMGMHFSFVEWGRYGFDGDR